MNERNTMTVLLDFLKWHTYLCFVLCILRVYFTDLLVITKKKQQKTQNNIFLQNTFLNLIFVFYF